MPSQYHSIVPAKFFTRKKIAQTTINFRLILNFTKIQVKTNRTECINGSHATLTETGKTKYLTRGTGAVAAAEKNSGNYDALLT